MRLSTLLLIIIIFLLGWFCSTLASSIIQETREFPFINFSGAERISPSDYIKENQILVLEDKVIINIEGVSWASYANTNSMDPFIDEGANGLEIVPICENIQVGDIIVYEANWIEGLVVHRVVSINEDDKGLYFRLKGDNSSVVDPQKVRCKDVKYQLIGVLY
jgi:signal peptidase I